jgi:hypothetical protein
VSKTFDGGLIGGHVPTLGFYSEGLVTPTESILGDISAQVGATPLIRIRFDLNGDGVYEVVEQEHVMSVGNLNRAIEYFTNRPRFGTASFTLRNNDLRWSDNNTHALSYFNPASPTRYHMRKCIIEVGFDGPKKADSWRPIFSGQIVEKVENAEAREAEFSLLDEWTRILAFDLAPTIRGDAFFDYYPAIADTRSLQLGTYYGAQRYIPLEAKSKDRQLLVPATANTAGPAYVIGPLVTYARYRLIQAQVGYGGQAFYNATISGNIDLYFWDWSNPTPQWIKIDKSNYANLAVYFILNTDTPGLYGGQTLTDYWTAAGADPQIGVAIEGVESNPVRILFDLLHDAYNMNLSINDIDASNANPSLWGGYDLDFADPAYHSFDISAHYLDLQGVNACVCINKSTPLKDLIDQICTLTRGSFFIDKGRKNLLDNPPLYRIRFIIHQPRLVQDTTLVLPADRLHGPTLTRSTDRVRNNVSVSHYNYGTGDKFDSVNVFNEQDTDSIAVYGQKDQIIDNKPGSAIWLYECANYAAFLAQHYIMVFAEPPMELKFDTDLLGLNWDLKSLLRVQEKSALGLDPLSTTLKDVFEIYSVDLNTSNFMMSFLALWAGYLMMPDGDSGKRWAFTDDACADEDGAGTEFYCW